MVAPRLGAGGRVRTVTARFTQLFTIIVACLLSSSSLGLAQPSTKSEAQKHFDAGLAYVDDPSGSKWEDALREFRSAYEISKNWKLLNNIGLCALNLERDAEAIEAYKEYLSHGGGKDLTAKQRKQMEKDIAMLSASLVRVNLQLEPSEAVLLDERRNAKGDTLLNQYPLKGGKASLGIHPGFHKFTLQAPGYVNAEWTFNAAPSSSHDHQFKLEPEKMAEVASGTSDPGVTTTTQTNPKPVTVSEPPAPEKKGTPAGVYIGLAATGVFAAAATVTGVLALGKEKSYRDSRDPD